MRLKAKLDTGATTSSLNAVNLRRFRRGGVSWARFEVLDPEVEGKRFTFQAPVVRTARIRRHDGLIQQRPVVKLAMCLGHVLLVRQFTLIDRSDFNYQVLVGRNFLRGKIVVDSASRFETRPECEWPDGRVADGGVGLRSALEAVDREAAARSEPATVEARVAFAVGIRNALPQHQQDQASAP